MKFQAAFLAGLVAISGCTSTSLTRTSVGVTPRVETTGQNTRVAGPIVNAMAGGLIGGTAGAGLDDKDRRSALEAEYRALEYTPSGQAVSWRGERSKHSGEVVAAQPYRVGSQDCRQYSHTLSIDGQARTARGTACRNVDGSWTPLT